MGLHWGTIRLVCLSVDVGTMSISEARIFTALNTVDVSKGDGPDDVSPLFLRNCSETLSWPLSIIFNHSLRGTFPSRLKVSYIVPIFMSGSR